ncbi:MAG TPA: hypothetical protein PLV70_13810, partial [Flavobacteriales bacterium]|nr:hypothetical protein [Flavobacteriales bacterium]
MNKLRACCRVAALLPLLWAAGPLGARTWTVDATGPNKRISVAVASAADGDTIRVLAGTYREGTITIDRRLALVGVGRPLIDGGEQGDVVVINAAGTTLRGFRITGTLVSNIND